MLATRMRRPVTGVLLLTFGIWVGCAGGSKTLSRSQLEDPEPADSYLVTTRGGEQVTLISLYLEGDWLVGTARFTTTEEEGEGEDVTTSVTNVYEEVRIPWDQIASVEAMGVKKVDSGFFLAGAAIAVGVIAFLVLTGGGDDEPVTNGGKPVP